MKASKQIRRAAEHGNPTVVVRTRKGHQEVECISLAYELGYEVVTMVPVRFTSRDILFRRTSI